MPAGRTDDRRIEEAARLHAAQEDVSMFARVMSFGVSGLQGYAVGVEVDTSGGLPQFAIGGPAGFRRQREQRAGAQRR